ncbi:hypothetical protein CPB85DRAFT_1259571 [Mucidula mucida]|nr:hypothetical protein CPB85DRAFT_1259571 [Mucidula mucida]
MIGLRSPPPSLLLFILQGARRAPASSKDDLSDNHADFNAINWFRHGMIVVNKFTRRACARASSPSFLARNAVTSVLLKTYARIFNILSCTPTDFCPDTEPANEDSVFLDGSHSDSSKRPQRIQVCGLISDNPTSIVLTLFILAMRTYSLAAHTWRRGHDGLYGSSNVEKRTQGNKAANASTMSAFVRQESPIPLAF